MALQIIDGVVIAHDGLSTTYASPTDVASTVKIKRRLTNRTIEKGKSIPHIFMDMAVTVPTTFCGSDTTDPCNRTAVAVAKLHFSLNPYMKDIGAKLIEVIRENLQVIENERIHLGFEPSSMKVVSN